jgi:uncharacterized membrane protein
MTSKVSAPAAVTAGQAALAALVAAFGTKGLVAMHFDLAGQVDRWGHRREAALMILGMAALSAIGSLLLRRDRRLNLDQVGRAQSLLLAVTSLVSLLAAAQGFGLVHGGLETPQLMMGLLWLMLMIVGAMMGKIAPNAFVGVRTPWSRASRLAWDKSNRLAGRLFFWGGLMGAACAPFAPQPEGMKLTTTAILVIAALCVFESWRVWRSDPERRPL